ncbi:MAG: sodium:solute symporter family transporter [Terriglobia bacterium]
MSRAFSSLDWSILICYIATISTIGSLFYRKRTSAAEYFLGGRSLRALPVALSLVAADMSAITYMGTPAWSYQHNLEEFWTTCSYVLVAPIVMYFILPFFMRFKFYTAYEYLQRRFDLRTRLVVSGLFLLMRGSHVAIAIYAPSIVLSLLTGFPLYLSVLVIGLFTTFYTTLGGMKAVIWTDVLQFSILLTGMLAVFWLSLSRIPGGVHTVYAVAGQAGRLRLWNFSFNPDELTAFWPAVIGGGVMVLATLGTDQAYLQRYFATRNLREGRRSIFMDACVLVPVNLVLFLLGPVLYTFYTCYPGRLQGLPRMDAILPFFVLHELGGVFSGLVIASIFASSMAVMSSGINALTTATTVDFYRGWLRQGASDSHYVTIGRWGTVAWGTLTTFGALFAARLGPLINAFNKINSFLGGPILGIFLLGMLSRRAKGKAAVAGGVVALIAVASIAATTNISFFYYALIGVLITLGVGYLLSLPGKPPNPALLFGLVRGLGTQSTTSNTLLGSARVAVSRKGSAAPMRALTSFGSKENNPLTPRISARSILRAGLGRFCSRAEASTPNADELPPLLN